MTAISSNVYKKIATSNEPLIPATAIANWMRLGPSAAIADMETIDMLTNAATDILTEYLWLALKRTTFEAYYSLDYNYFYDFVNGDLRLNLERSPIISTEDITKIEYLDNDIWNEFDVGTKTIDGLFDNATERLEQRGWASVYFLNGITFQNRLNTYKIRITFTAGFICGDLVYDLPPALKLAIMKIVAFHYTERGDCDDCCDVNGYPVPCSVKGVLDLWNVGKTVLGGSYNPVC